MEQCRHPTRSALRLFAAVSGVADATPILPRRDGINVVIYLRPCHDPDRRGPIRRDVHTFSSGKNKTTIFYSFHCSWLLAVPAFNIFRFREQPGVVIVFLAESDFVGSFFFSSRLCWSRHPTRTGHTFQAVR